MPLKDVERWSLSQDTATEIIASMRRCHSMMSAAVPVTPQALRAIFRSDVYW